MIKNINPKINPNYMMALPWYFKKEIIIRKKIFTKRR